MPKLTVTKKEIKKLRLVEHTFGENIAKNYGEGYEQAWYEACTLKDAFKMVASNLRWKFRKNSTPEKQAKALLHLCSTALPILKRAYGEDLLERSLPAEAKEQDIIDICRTFGSDDIADLSEKAKKLPSSTPPAGKSPTL